MSMLIGTEGRGTGRGLPAMAIGTGRERGTVEGGVADLAVTGIGEVGVACRERSTKVMKGQLKLFK